MRTSANILCTMRTSAVFQSEKKCSARKGHLTSVSSVVTNSVLRQSGSLCSIREFWLGGNYGIEAPQQWMWTGDRWFSHINWAGGKAPIFGVNHRTSREFTGQPVNCDSYCTADVSDGTWFSRPCNTRKPYICKVPPANGTLRENLIALSSCA